jgi:hypothetical protein
MKIQTLLFVLLIQAHFPLLASKDYAPSNQIDSTKFRSSLKEGESMFYFTFHNLPTLENRSKMVPIHNYRIIYAYDGQNRSVILGKKNEFEVSLKPGTYQFQLFYTDSYEEITTEKITINSRYKTFISCYLKYADRQPVMVEKPVIYLYPTVPTLVDVKVKPEGEFTFTYPEYKNGWKVLADPSGNLTLNDQHYNYLFWESSQQLNMEMVDLQKGFLIKGENALDFLEEKLTSAGFNAKEKADFITFWGPQLQKNTLNFIHFIANEQCDQFAELEISPKPDHIYRYYILTFPVTSEMNFTLEDQELPKMNRDGFTVLEWGGSQITTLHSPKILN